MRPETRSPNADLSLRAKARLAGIFELLEGFTSSGGQVFILDRLVVAGNAAATAASILGHERMFRFGFALSLAAVPLHVAWAVLFHDLFKPVNRSLSRLALFVMLVGCALQAVTSLLYYAPLQVLQGGGALSALPAPQLQALAYSFLKLNSQGFATYLVFFGLWCILAGVLILRSTFLPRILGVLLMIDGVGWTIYVWPPLAYHLFPFIAAASAIAELPLPWFIMFGINARRWEEQASVAAIG